MTNLQQKPYSNARQDAAFRFPCIPNLIRSTVETTNGMCFAKTQSC
jgi:hypothetical protein